MQTYLSGDIEKNTRMVAVQLPPAPQPRTRCGTFGVVDGPALVVPTQNEQIFADTAQALATVVAPLRIASRTGKIQWRRNPGKPGGGHVRAAAPAYAMQGMRAEEMVVVPDLAALADTMSQALRGVHELGDKGGDVHVVLDPVPMLPSEHAGKGPQDEGLESSLRMLRVPENVAVHLWLVAPHRWRKVACATPRSLRLQQELAAAYGWLEGATSMPRKGKTYAVALRNRGGGDLTELHYESEALKHLCLEPLPSLELLRLAAACPPLGVRLRVVEDPSAAALARALLGTPAAPEPAPPPRTLEMWMYDTTAQARLPPAVAPHPVALERGARVRVDTCSTDESRMTGEMDPVRDVNVRAVVTANPSQTGRPTEAALRSVDLGFMLRLEDGYDVSRLRLQYQVDGGPVQTAAVQTDEESWADATGSSTAELSAATGGQWTTLERALRALRARAGTFADDISPALALLYAQREDSQVSTTPPSWAAPGVRSPAAALRDLCQSLTTQVVQAFSRVVMPPAVPAPPPPPASSFLHPCMHRQGSVAISQLGGAGTQG